LQTGGEEGMSKDIKTKRRILIQNGSHLCMPLLASERVYEYKFAVASKETSKKAGNKPLAFLLGLFCSPESMATCSLVNVC
jgi:hypothetical protein